MTIVMKRKQSKGKEGKERKRKDKNNNNKDKKDTVSKSKSTTQKKRRRFTKKQKKAKLMKNRSIRRQRGGNPTERPVPDKQAAADAAARRKAQRDAEPDEDAVLADFGLGPGPGTTSAAQTQAEAEKVSIEASAAQTTSASQIQAKDTKKELQELQKRGLVSGQIANLEAEASKEARRKAMSYDRKKIYNSFTGYGDKEKIAKMQTFNVIKQDKYLYKFDLSAIKNIAEDISKNIFEINYKDVDQIDFVIKELVKTRIDNSKPEIDLETYYINTIEDNNKQRSKVIGSLIDVDYLLTNVTNAINRNNKILKNVTSKQDKIKNYIKKYTLIKHKIEIFKKLFKKLLEKQEELKAEEEEAARREAERQAAIQAEIEKRQVAEKVAEETRQAAEKAEEAGVKLAVDEIGNLNDESDEYIIEISRNIDELNKNDIDTSLVSNEDVYQILSSNNKKVKSIEEIKIRAERAKNMIDPNYYTQEDKNVVSNNITNIENTLTAAKTLQIEAIINTFILEGSREEIINGNTPQGTPPDTPKEEKLSKIAEQQYIVIPDPANNINPKYFCEEGFDGGIPAKAKNYQYYIIFLDGYDDDEGTEVKYKGETVDNIKNKQTIKDCKSGDASL